MHLNLTHRGRALALPDDDPATLRDLRIQISEALSVPYENIRLLTDGKILSRDQDDTPLSRLLRPSQNVLVLATTPQKIRTLNASKPDTTLRPFDATDPKYVAIPRRTPQKLARYSFGRVSALPNLPDSDRAQKILEQLASDRGFLSVMEKKKWNVGELREMPPEGRVGVDPVCVLGYNTNNGQQIHLRLRTDDMKGFRAMSSVRQVLAHELAHNEFSEHDDNFKELMRWIEKTAGRDNWRSLGQQLDEGWHAPSFAAGPSELIKVESESSGKKLGSEGPATGVSRLLQNNETRSTVMRSFAADGSTPAELERDVNGHQADLETTSTKSSPPRNTNAEVRSEFNRNDASSLEAASEPIVRESEHTESNTPLAELMSLGFSKELASLALRENSRNPSRAADWLLSQTGRPQRHSEMGDTEAELAQKIRNSLTSLEACLSSSQLVLVLDSLHLYMSNLLRHPGVERFCRINNENAAFQSRVGAFRDAVQILQVAGFRLVQGVWQYNSLDVSPAWITKSLVEELLLKELMK